MAPVNLDLSLNPHAEREARRTALELMRPVRRQLEDFQVRVAHLDALVGAQRGGRDALTVRAKLLCAEIDNAKHLFRTELQNQPRSIREAAAARDVLRAMNNAYGRARHVLDAGLGSLLD